MNIDNPFLIAINELVAVQKYISDNAVGVYQEIFGREINNKIDLQIFSLKKELNKNGSY